MRLYRTLTFLAFAGMPAFLLAEESAAEAEPAPTPAPHVLEKEDLQYRSFENFRDQYEFSMFEKEEKQLTLRSGGHRVEAEVGSRNILIDGSKFVLSRPVFREHDKVYLWNRDIDRLIDPILNPRQLQTDRVIATVILDPGHGGHDPGARSKFGNEKYFALDTARRAAKLLEKEGFEVVFTRNDDVFISLQQRVEEANQFINAILVSIHYNSGGPESTGVETFRLTPTGLPSTVDQPRATDDEPRPGSINEPENLALAAAMHRSLENQAKLPDRGVKQARFFVLKHSRIPAVLVEGGFVSNEEEAELIATPQYRQRIAKAIVQGVERYRDLLRYEKLKEAWSSTEEG